MKRFLTALGLSAITLMLSVPCLAGDTDPQWVRVSRADSSITRFAKKYGLTPKQLVALNRNLQEQRYPHLVRGVKYNINPQTSPEQREIMYWTIVGGDPAGPSLIPAYKRGDNLWPDLQSRALEQLAYMADLPEEVRDGLQNTIKTSTPEIVNLTSTDDYPLTMHNLVFGGYDRYRVVRQKHGKPDTIIVQSTIKYWVGPVVARWTDLRTRQRLLTQTAAIWPECRVTDQDYGYRFVVFLACQNSATIERLLPEEPPAEVVPPPPPPIVEMEPEPVPEPMPLPPPPPPPAPPVVEQEVQSRDYVTDYVAWLTDEYVRIDQNGKPLDERTMNNIFVGHEFTGWKSPAKRLGFRVRNAECLFDMKARSGDHNLGLVVVPFSNRYLRLDLEGGLGYSAIQRLYTEVQHPDEETWTWQEKKLTTDGFGPYVRTQWILPAGLYADLKYRDHGVISNRGGYITWRPNWFYAKVAYDYQLRPAKFRHVDGQTIPFAADSMKMNEARVGISFNARFLLYGSYQHWEYASGPDLNRTQYWFTKEGPGGGFELYPFRAMTWRVGGDIIRFKNFDHARFPYGPGWAEIKERNREWRFKLGLVFQPQPK